MAEAASRERLQPSLLDRLTDEVKGIESDIGRLRQELLPRLDEERSQALAQLLDPDRHEPLEPKALTPFTELGPAVVEQVERLIGLEQRRQLELKTRFVLTSERLRASVMRDLGALLNTPNLSWRQRAGGGCGAGGAARHRRFPGRRCQRRELRHPTTQRKDRPRS